MKRRKSFRHSSRLRNEPAMVRLRIALGASGYGIYFMLMEHLHQTGTPIDPADLDLLAYEFHVPVDDLRAVLQDFALFTLTPDGFTVEQTSSPATPATPVEQASSPATPSPTPLEHSNTQTLEHSSTQTLVEQMADDPMLMDALYEEIGDQKAFDRIIDNIIDSGQTFPDRDALLRTIRARIQEHLIDHPIPIYPRRQWQ